MTRIFVWIACFGLSSVVLAQLPMGKPPVGPAGPVELPIVPSLTTQPEPTPLPLRTDPPLSLPLPTTTTESPSASELRIAVERLKTEREALARQRQGLNLELSSATNRSDETTMLRMKIAELIGRLGERTRGDSPRPSQPLPLTERGVDTTAPRSSYSPIAPVAAAIEPADKVTLAQSLYQSGDTEAALRELRALDLNRLTRRDRAWVQFLIAGSLRKQGKLSEAAVYYREVADAKEDEFLTESATWHLGFLRWREDMQKQLDESRVRREAR